MEQTVIAEGDMIDQIREQFDIRDRDVREISALSLAFLGDAVYELVIRTVLTERGGQPGAISRRKTQLVNAVTQAKIARRLQRAQLLTEQEESILRRGRNASPRTIAKHATAQDYHLATGLECLMGYLYYSGQTDRAVELIRRGLVEAEESV